MEIISKVYYKKILLDTKYSSATVQIQLCIEHSGRVTHATPAGVFPKLIINMSRERNLCK